jgi:hypothetical protein
VDGADSAVGVARDDQQLDPSVSQPDLNRIVLTGHCQQLLISTDCHRFDRLWLEMSESQALVVDCDTLFCFFHNLHLLRLRNFLFRCAASCTLLFWRARLLFILRRLFHYFNFNVNCHDYCQNNCLLNYFDCFKCFNCRDLF